ncbi:MAG TPA: ferrochelatase [Sandaracinaceae bacterium LLY-WYZ-13_1]|nr:ferrochelatase [Sandaracinaceae bacterium LLY-WYZ-13_1]
MADYDAILVFSFGGPEGPDDVMPFLEKVVRGRNVPRERLLDVAEHYHHFGGVSPINARTRELVAALETELAAHGPRLPVYWGNRHWHPFLGDTLRTMRDDGVRRALAFVTSAFSSFSGCRAYREDLARARAELGEGAPEVDKIRPFFNHPGYVETCAARLREGFDALGTNDAHVMFSAHSIPIAMAEGCDYEAQLRDLSTSVAERLGVERWELVYQSRSGPPHVPWLEPDVGDALRDLAAREPGAAVVVAPFGFVADHMEVVWDLDEEARELAESLNLRFARAPAANDHPRFVRMARELIDERVGDGSERPALGTLGPRPDRCPEGCCAYRPRGRPRA